MAIKRVKFTEGSIDRLPFSQSGTDRYADIRKPTKKFRYFDQLQQAIAVGL